MSAVELQANPDEFWAQQERGIGEQPDFYIPVSIVRKDVQVFDEQGNVVPNKAPIFDNPEFLDLVRQQNSDGWVKNVSAKRLPDGEVLFLVHPIRKK